MTEDRDPTHLPFTGKKLGFSWEDAPHIDPSLHWRSQRADSIRSCAATVRKDISLIEAELNAVDDYTTALRAERARLVDFTERCKPVVSPAQLLHPELLSHICLLACSDWMEQRSSLDVARSHPWIFSRVCASWRSAAISTPRLWNTLCFFKTPGSVWSPSHTAYLTSTIISRTKNTPLTVHIRHSFTTAPCFEALKLLLGTSSRWVNATFLLKGPDWESNLSHFHLIRHKLPMLRNLSLIDVGGSGTTLRDPALYDVFWNAPQLREIQINGLHSTVFRLPWTQITSLALSSAYKENHGDPDILDVIRHLTNILDLEIRSSTIVIPSDATPIALPLLRRLRVFEEPTILDILILPSLQSLYVVVEDTLPCRMITSMVTRSSQPPLKKLSVSPLDLFDDEDIISLLRLVPQLSHLYIDAADDRPLALLTLDAANSTEVLLPCLKYIQFEDSSSIQPCIDTILDFLESRCAIGAEQADRKLKHAAFRIPCGSFSNPSRSHRLQKLTDAGLDFHEHLMFYPQDADGPEEWW
ncbi:hypothetical protein HGRIS_009108 [Hohenbuehelia grisea]|uniref:F-box domain-containing protein n=1 Tax=Hohenbuehelia grisea TaxID=104357 RepID=A0ABR3J043_9AGAR